MTDVEDIKTAITQLPPRARAEFRLWYEQFEADLWDQQIEADVKAGRLDVLAERAMKAFHTGDASEL